MFIATTQHILTLILGVYSTSINENPVTSETADLRVSQSGYIQKKPSKSSNKRSLSCKNGLLEKPHSSNFSLQATNNSRSTQDKVENVEQLELEIELKKLTIKNLNTQLFNCKSLKEIIEHQSKIKLLIKEGFKIPFDNVSFINKESKELIKYEDIVHFLLFDSEDISKVLGISTPVYPNYEEIIDNFQEKLQKGSLIVCFGDKIVDLLTKVKFRSSYFDVFEESI